MGPGRPSSPVMGPAAVLANGTAQGLLFFIFFLSTFCCCDRSICVWSWIHLLSFHLALIHFCSRLFLSLQADTSTAQENKVTVTLIAVVILFLVCQTPNAIQLIYTMNVTEHSNMGRGERDWSVPCFCLCKVMG